VQNPVPPATLRAWRWHQQGLDGRLAGRPPAEVLARSGWARSVGGVGPYLTLFSRAGTPRAQADAAVACCEIHELPSVRGCTYVVPAADFAVALQAAAQGGDSDMATARRLGVTDQEVDRLCRAVADALASGPLTPEELREGVGGAARTLGPDGAKKGLASTLPLALGRLQVLGEIRRVPTNGRLDQQRYRYARWQPNPLAGQARSPAEVHVELARRFFRWAGPAAPSEFQRFSGIGARAARIALAQLGLVALGPDDPRLMFPDDREALARFDPPRDPVYSLVSGLDGLVLLRRKVADLLDPADLARVAPGATPGAVLGTLSDLPSHAILERGRLVGLWEYDTGTGTIAWWAFTARNAQLEAAVARTETFVRADLGDARSFSLDSPTSRQPRITAIREAAR
jgi:hypothetical protein